MTHVLLQLSAELYEKIILNRKQASRLANARFEYYSIALDIVRMTQFLRLQKNPYPTT